MEIWKAVNLPLYKDYYEVSNMGRLRSKRTMKILKGGHDKDGYIINILCVNGLRKTVKRHQLVMHAFTTMPKDKPVINHKNEIKDDNRLSNIEWCNSHYNLMYGTGVERTHEKERKPVVVRFIPTGHTYKFNSLLDVCSLLGVDVSNASKCARGSSQYSHIGDFKFNYLGK